jgi:fucose permease
MAMLQVVINPLLRTSGGEENYAFTSVLAQLIFGAASFLSPLVYSYMVVNLDSRKSTGIFSVLQPLVPASMPWISLYWLFAVISFFMVVLMLASRFPKVELANDEKAGPWKTHLMLFKKPVVILYFIALFCYVGTEQGVSYWMSQFLFEYHKFDPQITGANAVAYFWGLMTAGGIIGLFLLKIMDSRRLLVIFTVLALITLSFALFGDSKISLIAFPIVGFFASVMYPIIFSLALSSVDEHHGSFAGILVTGIIGGAVVQLFIGELGNLFGLRTGMLFLYITLGYILSIGFWAKPLITNKTIFDKKE